MDEILLRLDKLEEEVVELKNTLSEHGHVSCRKLLKCYRCNKDLCKDCAMVCIRDTMEVITCDKCKFTFTY